MFIFATPEIEDLGVTALGDEDVGGFYITVNDVLDVGRIERIGDLHAD
jgi:hypothetical protein